MGSAYYAGTDLLTTRYAAALNRTHVVARRIGLLVPTCGSLRVYWQGVLIKTVRRHPWVGDSLRWKR